MAKKTNSAIFEYQNKKGEKLFGFKIYLGTDPLTKKKQITTRRGFKSYNQANTIFNQMKVDGVQEKVTDEITMNQLFDLWFKTYQNGVKESTAFKTKTMYSKHIEPVFGNVYINNIRPKDMQNYIDELSNKLVKFKIVMNYINRMYKYAINLNLATNNPAINVILPKKSSRPRRDTSTNFYNKYELDEFLETAKDVNDQVYTYFLLLAYTGLRRSEALALTWKDVDFQSNLIHVTKTLGDGFNYKSIILPPKTKKSFRSVPMSQKLASELRKYKLANAQYNKLFHTFNDRYVSLSKPAQWLRQVYDRNDNLRKITTHGFRHTFATLLFESNPNITPKDVQEMLGHETIEMSMNIYTHMTDQGKSRVLNALNNMNF